MRVVSPNVSLDPTAVPGTIDYYMSAGSDAGRTVPGIYELDGKTLRLCYHPERRPTEFASERGSGRSFTVWKRIGD